MILDSVDSIISNDMIKESENRDFLDKEIKKWAITNTLPHNLQVTLLNKKRDEEKKAIAKEA